MSDPRDPVVDAARKVLKTRDACNAEARRAEQPGERPWSSAPAVAMIWAEDELRAALRALDARPFGEPDLAAVLAECRSLRAELQGEQAVARAAVAERDAALAKLERVRAAIEAEHERLSSESEAAKDSGEWQYRSGLSEGCESLSAVSAALEAP